MTPLVSVIVPTCNRAAFLRRALQSILRQSHPHCEVIVVDDGSTDETAAVCSEHLGIRYIRQAHAGAAAARNRGLLAAGGDFIAYCDDDDVWYPNHVEVLLAYLLEHPHVGLVYCDADWIQDGRNLAAQYSVDFDKAALEAYNYVFCSSVLHRRECTDTVGRFDEQLECAEDWDLWLRIADRYVCWHLPVVLGEFVWHDDNVSGRSHQDSEYLVWRKRVLANLDSRWRRALLLPGQSALKAGALVELADYLGIDVAGAIPLMKANAESAATGAQDPGGAAGGVDPTCDPRLAYAVHLIDRDVREQQDLAWRYEQVLDLSRADGRRSCLEYGPGIASAGIFFARHGFAVTLAADSRLADFCRWRFASRDLPVHTVPQDSDALPRDVFDVAAVNVTPDWMDDPVRDLRDIALSVRQGGIVVCRRADAGDGGSGPVATAPGRLDPAQLREIGLRPSDYWQGDRWGLFCRAS